ncbi:hypothetical protein [Singulisphaera acidiphila]|uniref:Uncharacterized protein n=1 Tax=Singulisphaera acidiphila (strain ATCC BAA-1392 / DSM 18658 / VKM B-2454 / MOB10) TaxID=886293 RepID=L0DLW8_SINAD|nr:hypothetical protein [Singulisphaera acidiphila]AGA30247.1 hypothetical protein Sinac_6145 [Singulisphaera acidiphila DSM 18658]
MSQPDLANSTPVDWRRLHAYGWPGGSVRALMAILIFGTLWAHLALRPDREVPDSLRDLLFIILGHYFAVRGRQGIDPEGGPPPLYLPRGAVRLILIAGFLVVGALLHQQGRLTQVGKNPGVVTLILAAGFLLGVVMQRIMTLWSHGGRIPRAIEDVRATFSLVAAIGLAVLIWDQLLPFLPPSVHGTLNHVLLGFGRYGPEHLLAAIVGFYFGSRS